MAKKQIVSHEADRGLHKLSQPEQMEVCKLIGWFWSAKEIRNHIQENFGKDLVERSIAQYNTSDKWKPVIQKFREDYTKNIFDVPLANKRKRLDELQKQYEYYKYKDDRETCRAILKEVREEMDKKFGDVNFSFTQINHTEFQNYSDEALAQERMKTIEELGRIKRMRFLIEGKEMPNEIEEDVADSKENPN